MLLYIALAAVAIVALALGFVALRARGELAAFREKYQPIIDLEAEQERLQTVVARLCSDRDQLSAQAEAERAELAARYSAGLEVFNSLQREIALLEETSEDLSFGLYKPHFDFQSSEDFRAALEQARKRQKELVRSEGAAVCNTNWTVGGSRREGERMAKQNMKMVLRAFNAECDAAIANVSWNNVTKMEERIRKSFEALNKLGTVLQVHITQEYLTLKLDELRLTFEHEEKRQAEREEQRRIREQIREEERVQRELARAQEEAAKEELRFERALERARAEAAKASGEELAALNARMLQLEEELRKAHEQRERAKAMAELTKSGYVYIISNVGSFGERVYKVGMTRRLEPMDRIAELGDASVPFPFDVHAMLYSDNAPELERALHEHLSRDRVNLVNPRKEFFTADLSAIEAFAVRRGIQVEFTAVAEAREYRESEAIRLRRATMSPAATVEYPTSLFESAPPVVVAEL